MSKVWDKPITADTDWGGDASTDNLPVSGRQVQAWIKGNIKNDDAISLLIAKWLNEHTTNSITFWKGLPIDSGTLKWVDEHLTVIGGTGGSETPQDLPFIYDPVKKAWEFKGDFVVTGAITMFGSLSGFRPSTVTEAVEVDGETIVKTKNSQGQWQLTAIGGGGGTGGGISAAEVNILIENALKPYIKIETADDKYALISTVSGINSRLSAVETFFATEDSDTLINKWSEIVAFLNATEGDTLDNILATKANQSALDAAVASLTAEIGKKWTQNDAKISNWDSAYGWGNHANAGYAAKTHVDAELAKYVKLATAQSIEAQHNFVDGLQIGGLPITKSASANNTIYLDANLVVSGAITMFGSGSTTFPTIWANIPFNLEHMSWDGSQWNIIGGGGSGSLDTNAVNVLIYEYLTQNSYATISDISSTLVGYATQSWVSDNYLSKSGGTVNGNVTLNRLHTTEGVVLTNTGDSYSGLIPNSRITSGGEDKDFWLYNSNGAINHYATSYAFNGGNASFQGSITAVGNIYLGDDGESMLVMNRDYYNRFVAAKAGGRFAWRVNGQIDDVLVLDESGYLRSPIGFVGNLTGNADSATNADKLDDFHSYDFARANSRILAGSDINHIGYGYPDDGCMTAGPMISFGANSTYFAEIQAYLGHNRLLYREHNSDGYGNPKTFAFTDTNALSPSSGLLTVYGSLVIGGDTTISNGHLYFGAGGNWKIGTPYAVGHEVLYNYITFGAAENGIEYVSGKWTSSGDFIVHRFATRHSDHAIDIFNNGNVAIGGAYANTLLHVHGSITAGSIMANGNIEAGGITRSFEGYTINGLAESYCGLMPNRRISSAGDSRDLWLYNTHAISYEASIHTFWGDTTINGNLLTTGVITTPQINIGGLAAYKLQDDTLFIDANVVVRGAISMFGVNTLAEMESIEQRLLSLEQKVEQLSA